MIFYIKNMVCDRCVMVVDQQFKMLGFETVQIRLGEVETSNEPDADLVNKLKERLSQFGFELLDDKRSRIVEQIKTIIIQLVHGSPEPGIRKKLSVILSEKLNADYRYLSSLFTAVESITIERYLILQRIEKAKELILYNEMTLKQIADELGYSSVQHLSTQFKNITGLNPSHFKELKENKRQSLDKVGQMDA